MVSQRVERLLHEELAKLPEPLQQRVLEFARTLATRRADGAPGSSLTRFAGTIDRDHLSQMQSTIEQDCERIDEDAW